MPAKTEKGQLNLGFIMSVVLFLACLPLIWQINFYQNDDWVYYKMVKNFMAGNFISDPVSAPTFYFQGVLGTVFSAIFGVNHLPVLTLFISVLNFFLLYKILITSTRIGNKWALLISFIWLANPLNVYSSIGFMTENYLLFCVLVSLYFFGLYSLDRKPAHFVLYNLFLFLGLMTKQSALALALSYPLFFLVNKRWRDLWVQVLVSASLFLFYFLIFPKTAEMYEKPMRFHHFQNPEYIKQLSKVLLIYIAAFCSPMILFLFKGLGTPRWRNLLLFTAFSIILYILIFRDFKPNRLVWQEFFYLDNTLERRGFYPRGVMGTKFYFSGMYDLYKYWDILAKFSAAFVVAGLLMSVRKLKSQAHLLAFFGTYFVLMLLAQKVYDRYLSPFFLSFILIMAAQFDPAVLNKYIKRFIALILLTFTFFLLFYSYQFSMDFIMVNRYIWNRSLELADQEKVAPKYIKGTNAWKLSDLNIERNYLYDFTFDSISVNKDYGERYDLVEKKRISFPGSIFIEPYVYLYKKKVSSNMVI